METIHNEYVAPFSQELISDQTVTEIQQLKATNSTSQAYDPNADGDARELGGEVVDVPIGNGLLPFSFILLIYILRKAIQTKSYSKIK